MVALYGGRPTRGGSRTAGRCPASHRNAGAQPVERGTARPVDWSRDYLMPAVTEQRESRDLEAVSGALRFGIPPEEITRLSRVLSPLIAECREVCSEDPALVEPVGTFHPEEP